MLLTESNFKQRNKHSNSYNDTQELIRKAEQIKFLQISESQVIKGLLEALKKQQKNSWELVLHAGNDNSFKYIIKPSSRFGGMFLDVVDV